MVAKASSSMKNKVLRLLICLVVVLYCHRYGLFPIAFIYMLVGFVFFHYGYGEGGDDRIGYRLDGGEFFPKMRMTVVDAEMAMFVSIGVSVRCISVWDGDPR
ncbi:hypothetical protein EJB05_25427, partial [Eragrostis curvula]